MPSVREGSPWGEPPRGSASTLRRPPQFHDSPQVAVPSPRQQPFAAADGRRGGDVAGESRLLRRLEARLLGLLALALRLAALLLAFLVCANALVTGSLRLHLLGLTGLAGRIEPAALSGVLVVPTPFGGALRGDFVIASIILFICDWLLSRRSVAMRMR